MDTIIIACCLPDILDSVDFWIVDVVGKGGDNPKTTGDESTGLGGDDLDRSENILDQWINFGIYAAIERDDYNFATELLEPMKTMIWRKKWYGMNIRFGKYEKAEQVLNSLPEGDQEEIYFKNVQNINLKRFTGIRDSVWTITQTDIEQLKTIAESPYPSRGYAWSLYRLLTGKKLSLGLPSVAKELENNSKHGNSPKVHSRSEENQIPDYQIFPNPAVSELTIKAATDDKIMKVNIMNVNGELIYTKEIDGAQAKIDVSGLATGVYLVELYFEKGKKVHKKVILN